MISNASFHFTKLVTVIGVSPERSGQCLRNVEVDLVPRLSQSYVIDALEADSLMLTFGFKVAYKPSFPVIIFIISIYATSSSMPDLPLHYTAYSS